MDIMAFLEVMGTSEIAVVAAFFIGLMMALSPCPMATNVTAIAAVSRKAGQNRKTLLFGLSYTIGRMFTYIAIAATVVWIGISTQPVSMLLRGGEAFLGPLLIIIGILLSGRINLPSVKSSRLSGLKERLSEMGTLGSFALGALFAFAFCPFSAVLFFGMLVPLSVIANDAIILPSVFAFATGLPVIVFSLILSFGVSRLSSAINKVGAIDKWSRRIVSSVFIFVGLHCILSLFM